jgi:hypothetical protein
MPFYPGESGNPSGRPKGSRNKRSTVLLPEGDIDPAEHLSSVVSDPKQPAELRASAANMLLPYRYSKLGTIPAPRFVEDAITVPEFTSIQDAQNFLADLARRSAAGELELQCATDISNLVKNWVLSITAQDEFQLKLSASNGGSDTTIRIEGGLPPLPGTNINMDKEPSLNGSAINGHRPVIDHQETPALPESVAPSAQEPENA